MARYVLIDTKSNMVLNAIEYDGISLYFPPADTLIIQSNTAINGDSYINEQFVKQDQ